MAADDNPHPELPEAPPLPARQPLLDRVLGRPWPLVDVLVVKTDTCCLCETALAVLERHRRRLGLRIRLADISRHARLLAAYGQEIPVVFLNGRKRFFGRVDPVLLARAVEGARRASFSPTRP
jgi:hypothetical protein